MTRYYPFIPCKTEKAANVPYDWAFESTMLRHILIMILAIGMGGCAKLTKPGGLLYPTGQQWKLSKAVGLLAQGDTSAAADLLKDICAEPNVSGVTDEALFRLTILRLGSDRDMNSIVQAQNDLERLGKEYPSSSWAPLASRLAGLLASTHETRQQENRLNELNLSLKQENKELKELNLTQTKELKVVKDSNLFLTNENLELRKIIEKLKNLELELGRQPY